MHADLATYDAHDDLIADPHAVGCCDPSTPSADTSVGGYADLGPTDPTGTVEVDVSAPIESGTGATDGVVAAPAAPVDPDPTHDPVQVPLDSSAAGTISSPVLDAAASPSVSTTTDWLAGMDSPPVASTAVPSTAAWTGALETATAAAPATTATTDWATSLDSAPPEDHGAPVSTADWTTGMSAEPNPAANYATMLGQTSDPIDRWLMAGTIASAELMPMITLAPLGVSL